MALEDHHDTAQHTDYSTVQKLVKNYFQALSTQVDCETDGTCAFSNVANFGTFLGMRQMENTRSKKN
eukprot:8960004-Ditylum_brightwellii.AAC.1